MYKKIFGAVFTIFILFSSNAQVFGETGEQIEISEYYEYETFESGFGEVIQTSKIVFEIGKNANVHVKHIIEGTKWGGDEPKLIKMLPGKHSNPQLTDEDGDYLRPWGWTGETFEESEYIIAGQKPFSQYDLIAEYDLEDFLELNEGVLLHKHFDFPHDVMIYFDDEIEIIFANGRAVDISTANGINCMGCDIKIEFLDKTDPVIKKVNRSENKLEDISNTGEEFILEFFSNGKISDLNYIQELDYFSFNVNKEEQLFMVKIPLDLLLSPYHVYLTENDEERLMDSDQIRKSEHGQTETHANLSFRAESKGVIHVAGATEIEHQKLLAKLQERLVRSTEGVIPTEEENKVELEKEDSNEQFYENWGNTNSNDDEKYYIFIIIGIVAVIIIGIIIKVKKN